jgi:hypothetical protein
LDQDRVEIVTWQQSLLGPLVVSLVNGYSVKLLVGFIITLQSYFAGIDMTEEQLDVARAYIDEFATRLGWKPNLTFHHGYIERIEGEDRV